MSYKPSSFRLKKKSDLSPKTLPKIQVYDTKFNRLENLLLHILKSSCPRSKEFLSFSANLTDKLSAFSSYEQVCAEYDKLLKDTMNQIYANYLVEGAKQKFPNGIQVQPTAKITFNEKEGMYKVSLSEKKKMKYKLVTDYLLFGDEKYNMHVSFEYGSKNEYSEKLFPMILSHLSKFGREAYENSMESYYNSWDDLRYDLYVASEYAKYVFTYLDLETQNSFFDLQERKGENLYQLIITFFSSLPVTPGTEILKRKILTKEKFLSQFKNDKEQFPLVQAEIQMSRHLLSNAMNFTRDAHDQYLDVHIKASIFQQFYFQVLQTQILQEVKNEFQTNALGAMKVYPDADTAVSEMWKNIEQMISSYKTPLITKGEDFKVFEEVYLAFVNKKLQIEDRGLSTNLAYFESIKRGSLPPKQIGEFVPLRKSNIRTLEKSIKITFDSAEPKEFKYLAPANKDLPFTSNGIVFNSIVEYANYRVLVNVLEVPADVALLKMSEKLEGSLDDFIKRVQREQIIEKVDAFAKTDQATKLFEENANSKFVLDAKSCKPFLRDFLGEYMTDVKNMYIKENVVHIQNPGLVEFLDRKSLELMRAVDEVNKFFPNTLVSESAMLNFWKAIYKYHSSNASYKVQPEPVIINATQRLAYKHVVENVLYHLTMRSEEDLAQYVNMTFFDLNGEVQEVTKNDADFAINGIVSVLRTFVLNSEQKGPVKKEELQLALSLIINKDLDLGIDETNYWTTIISMNDLQVYSRILFIKKLHEVPQEEFYGPLDNPTSPEYNPGSPKYNPFSPPLGDVGEATA